RGDLLELRPVGPASVDVAPFAAPGERGSIAADQPVLEALVLTQADVKSISEVEGKARQSIVGITRRRFEPDDRRGDLAPGGVIGPAVAIAVRQAIDRAAGRDEDRAVARHGQVHRHASPLEEGARAFRLAVAIAILEDT